MSPDFFKEGRPQFRLVQGFVYLPLVTGPTPKPNKPQPERDS